MRHMNHGRIALACLVTLGALVHPAASDIKGSKWIPMGPAPDWQFFPGGETGRATTIAINPFSGQDVWIGTAGGGVWHSSDGGGSWSPMADDQPSLAIGSITLAGCSAGGGSTPARCDTIYVGTGENAIRRDTYYGAGLLIGSNSGVGPIAWTLVNGAPKYDFKYGNIYNVVLDPRTSGASRVIYITLSSGVTASASETTVTAPHPKGGWGIYKSVNNGVDWNLVFPGRPTDLEIDPNNPDILYAGMLNIGLFKSIDAGATWCPLNAGLSQPPGCTNSTFNSKLPNPLTTPFDHVEIAVAPSTAGTGATHLYASFGNCPDRLLADCQPSIFESTDGGATWTLKYQGTQSSWYDSSSYPPCPGGYTRYTHALTADPATPGTLWLGGILLCKSTDGGATWARSDTSNYGDPSAHIVGTCTGIFENRCQTHPDHHALVYAPGGNQVLFDANDGGVAISRDGGKFWGTSTKGLSAFEFQAITASDASPYILGGTQDNGGVLWQGSKQWTNTQCCGDGGFPVIEKSTPSNAYMTSNVGAAASSEVLPIRTLNGGTSWQFPPWWFGYDFAINNSEPRALYPPFFEDQNDVLQFATTHLWKSADFCGSWAAETPVPASLQPEPEIIYGSDVISAAALAPTNDQHAYIGYYSGRIFRTTALGCGGPSCFQCGTLTASGQSCAPLPGPVSSIAVHPTNDQVAYATVSGFSAGIHVYETLDGGLNWAQVTGSMPELNGVPANAIAIEASTAYLWLGTDTGVYRGTTDGKSWARFSDGMPRVPVYSFALDAAGAGIVAATHGRGAYQLTTTYLTQKVAGPIHKMVLDQPVLGGGFRPNQGCGMRLIREDGTVCASGSTDALGGVISTDAGGDLVSNKAGFFADMPYVWACGQGKCLGSGVLGCNLAANPLATVEVTCGAQVITRVVKQPGPIGTDPTSSTFTLRRTTPAVGGFFQLLPAVQSSDGATRLLCSVPVPFAPGDTKSAVLQNAVASITNDPTCRAAGVGAEYLPGSGPEVEDGFPINDALHLVAPSLSGNELFAAVRSDPGAGTGICFDAAGLEIPMLGELHEMKVHFTTPPGGAAGGTLTLTERSTLGDCSITIPTPSGATPAALAAAVAAAFQAGGIPGPNPDCPANANPRDVTASGGAVRTAMASEIEVCSADPAVGVQVAPQEICFSNADCDDGNPCTQDVCLPASGQCQSTPVPNGQACDDGNPCTTGNTCQSGQCGVAVVCGGGSACAPAVCDPATGGCVAQPKVCDDGNPCTTDACDEATGGCTFTPTTGSSCDDGNLCTVNDACILIPGTAVPICQGNFKCEDGDACTTDHCDQATGACSNPPTQCDDGNACTSDTCSGGTCVSTPLPAGSVCDDANACTTGGVCQPDPFTGAPTCTSQPVHCDDGDACTADTCDPTTGGCLHSQAAPGEVPPPLQFTSQSSFNWPAVPGAAFYNTYRGTIPANMMGHRPPAAPLYDQGCFEYGDAHADGMQVSIDAATPALGTGFYYLVSEQTECGEGRLGSDSNTTPIPNTAPCSNPAPPRLQIVKTHSGNFQQGQQGAVYQVVVSNAGTGPTYGVVTMSESAPSGLTLVAMSGAGWNCPPNGTTCDRGDVLASGAAYPPIQVTVNVAANAGSPQVNQVTASGGGSALATANDPTTIDVVAPALAIVKSHSGHFHRSQTGAAYTVTVSNTGNAPTSGTVTVTDNAPVGFTNVAMSGTGWTCPSPGSTCTRSDALAAGASWPDLTVTVDVAPDCPLPSVTNQVSASGGGSAGVATASDPTTIDYPLLALLKHHTGNFVQGQQGAIYLLTLQNQGFGPSTGTITVTEVTPSGLTLVSMAGPGWACPTAPGNTCTRSDSLASTAFFPDITVTMNVAPAAPSSIMNEADVTGGGSVGTGHAFDPTNIDTGRVVLGIVKTHAGDFVQGQQNATYTLTVSNGGNVATSGTVTVTENAPSGLTLVSMAGTGWTCPSPGNACTRSDALAPGASWPDITVTVNVAVNASSPLTNQAAATGGGDGTLHTANDPTNVLPGPPVLAVTKTHNGNFSQGQTNAQYKVTVSNVGSQPTIGPLTVDEMPPPGLSVVSLAGTGWTCGGIHCSRTDPLPPGSSYPVITVTVSVSPTATSPLVNQVQANGGGSPPAMATDSTTIIAAGVPSLSIVKTHSGNFFRGQLNATYTLTVSNNIGAGTTAGTVSVQELPPPGLQPVSMSGTGWTCNPTSCTRITTLAPGASYPSITVMVNVDPGAPSQVVNQARVSGGGAAPVTTTDPTIVTAAP